MAEVLIDFQVNTTSLDAAIDQLEKLGEVDAQTAAAFKKTNTELNARGTAAKKVGNELKSPVKELDNLEKKTKKFASEFEKAIELGVMDALNEMGLDIDEVRKKFEQLSTGTGKSSDTLKSKLREVTAELQQLQLAGEQNSARYKELTQLAGEYGDAIDEVNNQIKNSRDGEKTINGIVNAAQALTGAFVGVQGAMALFGDESENTQRMLVKLNGAMAVLQGLQAVITGLQSDGAITLAALNVQQKIAVVQTNLETAAQSKNIVVKKAATAAQWLLNAAMNANPIGLLVTAVAALATALIIYTRNSRQAAEATGELQGAVKNLREGVDETVESINNLTERELIDLERVGAKQSELLKARLAGIRNTIDANQQAYNRNKEIFDKGLGDEEKREELAKELAATRKKTIQLRIDASRLEMEVQKQLLEEEKQAAEERKRIEEEKERKAQEALEAQKKRIQDAIFRLKEEQLQVDEGTLTYNRLQAAIVLLEGKYNSLGVSAAQASFEMANAAKENEKLLRDQSSAIDATLNKIKKSSIDTSRALSGVVAGGIKQIGANVAEAESDFDKFIEETIPKIQAGLNALQELSAGMNALFQERQENLRIEMDGERARIEQLLESGAITEKEAERRQQRLDKIESTQRIKAARQAKQLAIFQAIISTAQAVVNALATPPAPVGIALAAVVGAIGAAQIAAIASRPIPAFAKGKKDNYSGPGLVGERGAELIQKNGRMYIAAKPTIIDLGMRDRVFTAAETKRMLPTVDKEAMRPVPVKEFDYSKLISTPKTNNVSINIDKEFISEAVANGLQKNIYYDRRYRSK